MSSDPFHTEYRPLTDDEKVLIADIKARAADLYVRIERAKPSREQSLAKTALEEAVMWVVKGIAK